jgi:hypothetical protein
MRYRQDVAPGTDIPEIARHIVEHLAGAVDPHDNPQHGRHEVRVTVNPHEDLHTNLTTIVGEIDGEPDAPYLRPGFNPAADHPEIAFTPYEEPALGHYANRAALRVFREFQPGRSL